MKDFIEVNVIDYGSPYLLNVHHITEVVDNVIWLSYTHYECKETYNQIKDKIEEALR